MEPIINNEAYDEFWNETGSIIGNEIYGEVRNNIKTNML